MTSSKRSHFFTLKGLSVVDWNLGDQSWTFGKGPDEVGVDTRDPNNGFQSIRQIYFHVNPEYSGRTTVPVLWDKANKTIVSNESSEIIRMLNSEFNAFSKNPSLDLYPEPLRTQIDEVNDFVYPNINNGVYRCGFATTQEACMSLFSILSRFSAYQFSFSHPLPLDEEAFDILFNALDKIEERLTTSRYLVGNTLTEADVRLFTTLVRFDPVYVGT